MAIYDQGSFGYGSGQCVATSGGQWGSTNDYQMSFTAIRFPQPMRIKRAAFKMGKFYGTSNYGGALNTKGGFIGRYIVWDAAGNPIGWTHELQSYEAMSGNQINRADNWATFENVPKLEANTTYYIGWSCSHAQYFSFINYYSGGTRFNSNTGNYGISSINWGDVDDGVLYANGGMNKKPAVALFKIDAEPANTGVKLYANNRWNPRHGIYCYGGGWREQYLYYFNGHSWVDVTS